MTIPMEASAVVSPDMPGKGPEKKRDGAFSCAFPSNSLSGDIKLQAGYSLVELAAAIIIIGITLPALVGFFAGILRDSVESEMINRAIFLAHEKMEEISADKYGHGFNYLAGPALYPPENIDQFIRTVSISNVKREGIDGVEVLVSISHPALMNTYSLTQFFTDYDEYKDE
jgi:hypothetical protein